MIRENEKIEIGDLLIKTNHKTIGLVLDRKVVKVDPAKKGNKKNTRVLLTTSWAAAHPRDGAAVDGDVVRSFEPIEIYEEYFIRSGLYDLQKAKRCTQKNSKSVT